MRDLPRILITNNHLKRIGGSEIVVLELAEAFLNRGWRVDVFAPELGAPMEGEFARLANATSLRLINDVDFSFEDRYALIWIQHGSIPTSILESFSKEGGVRTAVIWAHLSALQTVYMEQPLQAQTEQAISDVVVAVSDEAGRWIEQFGIDREQMFLFENPAPDRFADTPVVLDPESLRKILCVSRHPPREVLEARELLIRAGHRCDLLGQEVVLRLEPEILKQYDAVITIGKTVQYALSMGMPCYIYDHFGGDGWLGESNFEDNAAYNFSGRNGGRKVAANKLCWEVRSLFAEACRFAQANRDRLAERYRLSRRIDALLELPALRQPKLKLIESGQCLQLRQYAAFVRHTHAALIAMNAELARKNAMISKLKQTLQVERVKTKKLCSDMERHVDRWNSRPWVKRAFQPLQLPEKYKRIGGIGS